MLNSAWPSNRALVAGGLACTLFVLLDRLTSLEPAGGLRVSLPIAGLAFVATIGLVATGYSLLSSGLTLVAFAFNCLIAMVVLLCLAAVGNYSATLWQSIAKNSPIGQSDYETLIATILGIGYFIGALLGMLIAVVLNSDQ